MYEWCGIMFEKEIPGRQCVVKDRRDNRFAKIKMKPRCKESKRRCTGKCISDVFGNDGMEDDVDNNTVDGNMVEVIYEN